MLAPRQMLNVPTYIEAPKNRYDVAANIAHVLMANGAGIFDTITGNISAKDQRRVFGLFLGKGKLIIDGQKDTVCATYQTAFGGDQERSVWMECQRGMVGRNFYSATGQSKRELEVEAAEAWF